MGEGGDGGQREMRSVNAAEENQIKGKAAEMGELQRWRCGLGEDEVE